MHYLGSASQAVCPNCKGAVVTVQGDDLLALSGGDDAGLKLDCESRYARVFSAPFPSRLCHSNL